MSGKSSINILKELRKNANKTLKQKLEELTKVGSWSSHGTKSPKITIDVYKPKKSNYYINIKNKGPFSKIHFGPLKGITLLPPLEIDYIRKKPLKEPEHRITIKYSKTGSHHGSPMFSYVEGMTLFFKDETQFNSLFKFLKKYTSNVVDKRVKNKKNKRTKRTKRTKQTKRTKRRRR